MKNEKGSVLLVAIIIMFTITFIAVIASKSTIFESKIVRSQKIIDEEFANAEAALNLAVRNFRNLQDINGYSIAALLNDRTFPSTDPSGAYNPQALYINNSTLSFPEDPAKPVAKIEIRRITDPGLSAAALSPIANDVPILSHRYYAGSIDRKRFAITVTAYKKNSSTLSSTWIKKGVDLPSRQNNDIF